MLTAAFSTTGPMRSYWLMESDLFSTAPKAQVLVADFFALTYLSARPTKFLLSRRLLFLIDFNKEIFVFAVGRTMDGKLFENEVLHGYLLWLLKSFPCVVLGGILLILYGTMKK